MPPPNAQFDFIAYKRETVRLDFIAEQLRCSIRQTRSLQEKDQQKLLQRQQALNDDENKFHDLQLTRETELLQLEKTCRLVRQKRLELEAFTCRINAHLDEIERKINKTNHSVTVLEQHKFFLTDVISHKISPRTPSTGRTAKTEDADNEVIQNTALLSERLQQKEGRLITLTNLLMWAGTLVSTTTCPEDAGPRDEPVAAEGPATTGNKFRDYATLNDEVFAKVHVIYNKFVTQRSFQDPLENFSNLENFSYDLLNATDNCDSRTLDKIMQKVANDKKKQLLSQKQRQVKEDRERRERVALERAMSAPTTFQRTSVNRKQRVMAKLKQLVHQGSSLERQADDLSHLFTRMTSALP